MYKSEAFGKGGIYAKVVADSVNAANGGRLITFELNYHRFIHAEFMTHRVFSRNASSSRAIPVHKMIDQVRTNPAIPIHWGKNQPGMQASEELADWDLHETRDAWLAASSHAWREAERMADAGAHKQIVNRILEPFQFIKVIVTATEWENFFKLRDHADAQPEIRELAQCIGRAKRDSTPCELGEGSWHLPYISEDDVSQLYLDHQDNPDYLIKASVARCARVSYLNHDNSNPNLEKDIDLHDKLWEAGHLSPFEHVATPDEGWFANFYMFKSLRFIKENDL